jgi:hypothetical protein
MDICWKLGGRDGVELVGAWDVFFVDDGDMRVRRELDCSKD